jgi:hypothetical protein
MDNPALIAIIVVIVVAIVGVVAFVALRKRRTEELRSRFGPEYDRALKESGDRGRAETALLRRRKRVERLNIRPISREDSARFTEAWGRVQTRFVDDPKGAVTEADRLLGDLMTTRGYPVGDFDQRAEDISVHHPGVVENYRIAHEIALRHAKGEASTEDLRQAMIHYRALFENLLGDRVMTTAGTAPAQEERERKKMS